MMLFEILFIAIIIGFVVFIFGREIYRKSRKLPSGECSYCHRNSKKLVKNYYKKYKKNNCNCN